MGKLKILAIGLIALICLGVGALLVAAPTLNVLAQMARLISPPAELDDEETNSIVLDLAQSSLNQSAGSTASDDPAKNADKAKPTPAADDKTDSVRVAQAIAKFFGVSVEAVNKLRADGFGYGEIVRIYALAKSTGKSVADIVALKKNGAGWGEIEKSLNVTPGKLNSTLGTIMRDNNSKGKKEKLGEREDDQDDKDDKDKSQNVHGTPTPGGNSPGRGRGNGK